MSDDGQILALLELFYDVDTNNSGTISRREMREFLAKEGFDARSADNVVKLFDLNQSGLITFDEWCTKLGVDHKTVKRQTHVLPSDVTLVSADMNSSMQVKICNMARDQIAKSKDMKEAAKNLKAALDKRFDRLWHAVIVKGQYWAYYSHEPKYSFVFKLGTYIVVVWRTPMLA